MGERQHQAKQYRDVFKILSQIEFDPNSFPSSSLGGFWVMSYVKIEALNKYWMRDNPFVYIYVTVRLES